MIKLYRPATHDPAQIEYWEAWPGEGRQVVLHKGVIGDKGLTSSVRVPRLGSAQKVMAAEEAEARAEGYAEIAPEAHAQVVIQVPLSGDAEYDWQTVEWLESLCNEILGWTGNGACDGNDIGAGTINVFSEAVVADVAVEHLGKALHNDGTLEFTIAVREPGSDDLQIRWPGPGTPPM